MMVTIQIMSHLNGAQLGMSTHQEPTVKAAQEYAAHWTYEMVKDGFVPDGAMLTYLIYTTPISFTPEIHAVVSYLHTEDAPVTTE